MRTHTLAAAASAALVASFASAGTVYNFNGISNNSVIDTQIAEAQLSVEVFDQAGSAAFLFTNSGPLASSIVQIYWDDNAGVLNSLTSFSTTTPGGVKYDAGSASPGNLPAGNPAGFSADYSIDPQNAGGKAPNGVGVGENLTVLFSYSGAFQDILNALDAGTLKVGIHVQAFDSGGSESLVSVPPTNSVPTPAAALTGLALMGLTAGRRRRK